MKTDIHEMDIFFNTTVHTGFVHTVYHITVYCCLFVYLCGTLTLTNTDKLKM